MYICTGADDEFATAFENCQVPNDAFHHREHLRLAWIYLRRFGSEAGLQIRVAILRFAAAHGKADKYHETITFAWLRLVADGAERSNARSFAELLRASPELLDKNTLHQHYSPELLGSDAARTRFVPPDRKPLPAGTSVSAVRSTP
ncbi:MAG TPA: hypothetical protein VF146_08050 [Bryobacteraceae bacterium]